jgi:hypothetical protein
MEFEEKDRHPDWLWSIGLIALLSAIVCFFYGNIFFGIFLIIAGAVTILYALQKPKELTILINDKGVSINNELIEYKTLSAFWLDENGKHDTLLLLVKSSFMPQLALPLVGVKADEVRALLAQYTKEEEMRQSRSIALFERIGF